MQDQSQALEEAQAHAADLVDCLQNADAPQDLLDQAEQVQARVNEMER